MSLHELLCANFFASSRELLASLREIHYKNAKYRKGIKQFATYIYRQ